MADIFEEYNNTLYKKESRFIPFSLEDIGAGSLVSLADRSSDQIQSPNYAENSSGWRISRDGSTEFRSGTIGGWTIGATTLTGGSVSLDSSGTISGATIIGSTLQTGTSGANVDITSSRLRVRSSSNEALFLELGTQGGTLGLNDTSGNSKGSFSVDDASGNMRLKAVSGNLYIDASAANKDVLFIGSSGNDVYPATDNAMSLGVSSNRWSDLRSVLINGADIGFANGWKFREYPATKNDIGNPDEWFKENANLGIQLLDHEENMIAVFHKNGKIYCNGIFPLEDLKNL